MLPAKEGVTIRLTRERPRPTEPETARPPLVERRDWQAKLRERLLGLSWKAIAPEAQS